MTEPPLFGPAAGGSGPSPESGPTGEPAPPTPWGTPEPPPVAPPQPSGPAGWTANTPVTPPPPGPGSASAPGWTPSGPAPMPAGAPPRPPAAGGSRSAVIGVIVVVVLLVAIGGIGAYALIGSGSPTPSPRASTIAGASASPSATPGALVFSDDFHDPASGWVTDTLPSGTTFKYTPAGFEVFAKGALHHIAAAPYERVRPKLSISMTATQSSPAPDSAGFGVTCDRGTGEEEIRYEFIAYADGTWTIERLDGPLSTTGAPPDVLKQGALSAKPGATPLTIQGNCVTQADGQSTRLTLSINGVQVTEITDTATTLPGTGWYAELLVSSDDPPTTVIVTKFEVRLVP